MISLSKMKNVTFYGRVLRERAENEQLYKVDLPEADIPPEVLMALLGIKEVQEPYDVKDDSNGDID